MGDKQIPYGTIGKSSLLERIRNKLPEGAYPTKKTPKILGIIFLIVVVLGVAQFPFGGIMSGNTNIEIKIGIPLTFLNFKLFAPEENPVRFWNMILDVIIYVILAYLIDIAINMFMHARFMRSEEDKKKIPVVYKNPTKRTESSSQNSLAEKVTSKVFEK